jgi:hypothetical protein
VLVDAAVTATTDEASCRRPPIDEALEATRKTDIDLAILNVDLKGRSVSPVEESRRTYTPAHPVFAIFCSFGTTILQLLVQSQIILRGSLKVHSVVPHSK